MKFHEEKDIYLARSVCNNCNLDFLFNLEASAPIKKIDSKFWKAEFA